MKFPGSSTQLSAYVSLSHTFSPFSSQIFFPKLFLDFSHRSFFYNLPCTAYKKILKENRGNKLKFPRIYFFSCIFFQSIKNVSIIFHVFHRSCHLDIKKPDRKKKPDINVIKIQK